MSMLSRRRAGAEAGPGPALPGRTTLLALWLAVLVAQARAGWPDGQVEVLGDLEASMSSAVLADWQEAVANAASATAAPPASGFPDSSAVVGRVFQMKVPTKATSVGSTVKLAEVGKEVLPSWLHWDSGSHVLQGIPLEADKGVYYISVSVSEPNGNESQADVFSVEVHPEEHADSDPIQLTLQPASNEAQPFVCGNEEAVTVLTVILDADLTKMSSRQRVELLSRMKKFSGVGLQHMKILPVVNNRLFDMSAFMAGPGNAKKVVENGALLSWKLGCALDQSSVPNISSVQAPAKEGTMSAQLGYPVVGWHIANKKPHVAKRIRRHVNNTPTPVPSILPPTTYPEPSARIVPTPTSPSIAPPQTALPLRSEAQYPCRSSPPSEPETPLPTPQPWALLSPPG
ncbi:hypothetical protein AGOR_G00152700 [Albula goreensis]|uniref:Dystroglycan-type cadherin-like domain-containing protein n=1 Tax=Albula goreensis TaxID=1534307 RepID=A0A8T3D412_9TELE|nr:hypothetical protein AGOR_G00152700 [Albula goreensis]